MKKILKKVLGGALALVMLLTVIPAQKAEAAASMINVNQTYTYDFVEGDGQNGEKMLQFTAPTNGYFTVNCMMNKGKWGLNYLNVMDSFGNKINQEIWLDEGQGNSTDIYATKAGNVFLLKLEFDDSHLDYGYNCTIRVNFIETDSWENESNDTSDTACLLTANQWKYGSITSNDSYDFFKFNLNSNSKVNVTFGPKEVSGNNNYWRVVIINSDGESYTLNNGYDISTQKTESLYLKKGTYYLRVENYVDAENIPYMLHYTASNFSVKQASIKKVSVKKYSHSKYRYLNYVTLKKNSDVDGFALQVAKKKNMKGKLINKVMELESGYISKSKINYNKWASNNSLSTQKKYYARVRAYVNDPFGAKIYGKWSKVKKS